jgi:membrane dipeptidase
MSNRQISVFDGHNDTLTALGPVDGKAGRSFLERSNEGHLDLPRARAGGVIGGIFAVFTPPPSNSSERDPLFGATFTAGGYDFKQHSELEYEYARDFTAAILASLYTLEVEAQGQIAVVRSYAELERNLEDGVFSLVLHLEGAEAVQADLSNLETYYTQGLRSLGITWSRPNRFGYGVPYRFPHSPDTGPGLTTAGRELVRACNRLGIVLDLAHLNERGFWDVAELSEHPLVVSHAGVHSLCASTRNLTDKQIDVVGQSNGLVGIIFEPLAIRADGTRQAATPLTDIVSHIDYVVERIGINHVAFGSDFDGAQMPLELGDAAGLPRLMEALRARGYDDEALEKIGYRNWFRIFQESWHRQ